MASTPSSADFMVTLKVNYDGTTRRFKLPLRDMVAGSLVDKIRDFLSIPAGTDCIFERFSDSAGKYVVLDPENVSVYKQLYRAAKAKAKLKIRVTNNEQTQEEKQAPRPVTVEDVPEFSQALASPTEAREPPNPTKEPTVEPDNSKITLLTSDNFPAQPYDRNELDARVNSIEQVFANKIKDVMARPSVFAEPAGNMAQSLASAGPVASGLEEFRVCCNSCEKTIPDSHYHCSKCDDDDFDLCESCVDKGITCHGADHWLIRRFKKDGVFTSSTTERIAPRRKPVVNVPNLDTVMLDFSKLEARRPNLQVPLHVPYMPHGPAESPSRQPVSMRTCNSCVTDLPEHHFLHCTSCEDFDLCKTCFAKNKHGHHPKHGFLPAVENCVMPDHIAAKLGPGRNQLHEAICDGCDKFINGVRHKCLDCPDWDYCGECVVNASFIHPNHRFVPVYEPITERRSARTYQSVHLRICCDGPLCAARKKSNTYITGVRYKCAVCHDTDFCANCEASPANTHNRTHPLIKFKTPVRHVNVTTMGEHVDGTQMPQMGDRNRSSVRSPAPKSSNVAHSNRVQTVVDVEPSESIPARDEGSVPDPEPDSKSKPEPEPQLVSVPEKEEANDEVVANKSSPALEVEKAYPASSDLVAIYVRDTVTDGTLLPPNHVFEQTWVLRNAGPVAWPAGCSVKFVGGDYMGHVDSSHPAGISELVSASESTVCYEPLAPGEEFPFTALLRTPAREGKIISYWRLTTKDGLKFGHRLWCDVSVQTPKTKEDLKPAPDVCKDKATTESTQTSQMIFPKLEKESPLSSIHEEAGSAQEPQAVAPAEMDDFEDCVDDEWDGSEDGFMTDEEYDILDASDEEYLEEQHKLLKK